MSIDSPENVATPLEADRVSAPDSVPGPPKLPMARVIEAELVVTVLPRASCTATTTENDAPPVVFGGWVVKASCDAAPARTVNVALVPAVRLSPLVRLAVRLTPDSALL